MTIVASKNGWCSDMLWLFVPPAPWRLFDAYRFLIWLKVSRDHNRQAVGKLRKFAVFALFEGLWKALGRCSSPVCRINEKLANTAFASSFFARKSGLPLILTLIDAYGSAKPIPALFARCIKIPLADLLCFKAGKSRFCGFVFVCWQSVNYVIQYTQQTQGQICFRKAAWGFYVRVITTEW